MGIPVENVKQALSAMLQKELYAIFTVPTGGIEPILEGLEEHLAFQTGLERDGIMFAAGPMWSNDGSEWNGDGLVVVRASSREEAILIAERNPMHISGARRFTVRPWMVNEGTMTVRLAMSSQTFTLL